MGQDHSGWTDERVERLKELWAQGQSAAQIAMDLDAISRNAIIGKARRLGLPQHSYTTKKLNARLLTPRGDRVRGSPTGQRHHNNLASVNAERHAAREDPGLQLPASAPLPGSAPRPWITRTFGECAWPIGEGEGPDLLSCCLPVVEKGWCLAHFVRGTQRPAQSSKPAGAERHRRAA